MKKSPPSNNWAPFSEIFLWVGVSCVLWFLSFPNPIFDNGLGFLGFFALIPVFYILPRIKIPRTFLIGFFWGAISSVLSQIWLGGFHPLGLVLVPGLFGLYGAILFPLLALAARLFPRGGFLIQALIWTFIEYLRCQGFLGYSYSLIAATQYGNIPFIQAADLMGIWGISFFVLVPGALVGNFFHWIKIKINVFTKWTWIPLLGVASLALIFPWVYGLSREKDDSSQWTWKPALIQQDMDPFGVGDETYRQGLERLTSLSQEALKRSPDGVIWSETAFVPSIRYHDKYREPGFEDRWRLVRRLLDFLEGQKIPFLVGNGDGEKKLKDGVIQRLDWNSALLFQGKEVSQVYRKVHLVPFTESFPFKDTLKPVYDLLKNLDTHFWEPGDGNVLLNFGGVKAGPLICFEDTFPDQARSYVLDGAQVLVNLTNDSWAHSKAAMMHHFSLAVFRAVENRVPLVRAANGGITAALNSRGEILGALEVFKPGFLVQAVPLRPENLGPTVYTLWGDWFPLGAMVLSIGFLALGILVFWGKRSQKVDNLGNVMENGSSGS